MVLVNIGPFIVPLPEGADVSSMERLRETMERFTPANFLFPFLGHALGTLVGAIVAAKWSASRKMIPAMAVGVAFLAGGVVAMTMIGGPIWFNACDLLLAYIPMAWLGSYLAGQKQAHKP